MACPVRFWPREYGTSLYSDLVQRMRWSTTMYRLLLYCAMSRFLNPLGRPRLRLVIVGSPHWQ